MFGFFKNILKGRQKKSIADARVILKRGTPQELRALAEDAATPPEILYFLAKSDNADVRRAVAVNRATPVQASALLANDASVDVRYALAARLIELLPELSPDEHSQLYAYAVQALGLLAEDEVLKIRRALATALQDHVKAPPSVVGKLARDIERAISEPILRFCVTLADEDLLDILSGHPEPWVISAVAGRPAVSEGVADAVFNTGDIPATTVLVNNAGARFSAETLQKIIEKAKEHPEWHQPIALRKELSIELAQQLAGFVSEAVLSVLEKRSDFDAVTRHTVADIVRRRLSYQSTPASETPEARADRLAREGRLLPDTIHDAVAWRDFEFVYAGLAKLSGIHPLIVKKMLRSGSAKAIVALCFQAKVPMRICIELQKTIGKLQPRELMYARGGTDYPLTPDEIKWQLEFFGVK